MSRTEAALGWTYDQMDEGVILLKGANHVRRPIRGTVIDNKEFCLWEDRSHSRVPLGDIRGLIEGGRRDEDPTLFRPHTDLAHTKARDYFRRPVSRMLP